MLLQTAALKAEIQTWKRFFSNHFQPLFSKLWHHPCGPFVAHQCAGAHGLKIAGHPSLTLHLPIMEILPSQPVCLQLHFPKCLEIYQPPFLQSVISSLQLFARPLLFSATPTNLSVMSFLSSECSFSALVAAIPFSSSQPNSRSALN